MIIWGAMLIPVVGAIIKLTCFRKRVLVWEFLLPFLLSVFLIGLLKWGVETTQTYDTEFHGGWAETCEYYEDWNERVACSHPKYRQVRRTDSNGNVYYEQVFDGYEHAYDVDYHSEYWELRDSNGNTLRISERTFETLARRWQNRKFVDLRRNYHTNDGDKYVTNCPGDDDTLEPVTTKHGYTNKVQASRSVFNFEEVDDKTKRAYALFDYPEVEGYYQRSILGDGGPTTQAAERLLQIANARLGRPKQVKMFILLYRNQPLEAALYQEALWKGGNKNEFVLCIGVDNSDRPQWAKAFSWSEAERLKVDAREFVGQTFIDARRELDLTSVVDWMFVEVRKQFVRKPFADFDYLSVDPPLWGVIVAYLLTLMANMVLSFWLVVNEHNEPEPLRSRSNRVRSRQSSL